jgi:hypothetical protein
LLRPYAANWWGGFSSDSRKAIRGGISTWGQLQPASDSWNYGISPRISWRAASNMDFTLGPQVSRRFNSWQYLTQETVGDADHYIFGRLRQTVASMTFRGNVTFTPTLSLQLYAEPFVASGDYEGFRQVADPRADQFQDRFDDFGPDRLIESDGEYAIDLDSDGTAEIDLGNPDFTFLSFRSNTVLRWEYKPGSALFLVWQHGRTDDNDRGQFRLRQGIRDLFHAEAVNTFVVKCTFWLGR